MCIWRSPIHIIARLPGLTFAQHRMSVGYSIGDSSLVRDDYIVTINFPVILNLLLQHIDFPCASFIFIAIFIDQMGQASVTFRFNKCPGSEHLGDFLVAALSWIGCSTQSTFIFVSDQVIRSHRCSTSMLLALTIHQVLICFVSAGRVMDRAILSGTAGSTSIDRMGIMRLVDLKVAPT